MRSGMTSCSAPWSSLHAGDGDGGAAGAGDVGAHGVEEFRQVHDFGFAGGAFDDGHAFGQRGGHHDVGGAQHGGAGAAAEKHGVADELSGGGLHVAVVDVDFGAEGLEAFEVQIDGARADDAAAGQGDRAPFSNAPATGPAMQMEPRILRTSS